MKSDERKSKKIFSRMITLVCLAVFIYSSYELTSILLEYYHNRKVLAEAQELFYHADSDERDEKQMRKAFYELQAINEDIIGWVTIEGTKIDYPVLQADDNKYYLNRNYKREHSRAGSIFMDYRNDYEMMQDKNIILYGHRMKDDTMFNQLKRYVDKEFFDSHPIVLFDTLYDRFDAEIFSVYRTTTDFDYIKTDFESDEEFQEFLDIIQEKSLHQSDVAVTKDDKILTLSTCDYMLDPDKGRLVVHAKLVERKS